MNKALFVLAIFIMAVFSLSAQHNHSDANIVGNVINQSGEHLAFASVSLNGTTLGTTTDESGHYHLIDLPEGSYIIKAQYLGYIPQEFSVTVKKDITEEVKFTLQKDILGIEQVVITGDRNESNRKQSSVIVNTLNSAEFNKTQSVTLSEGLNFIPGLRMENNCQNCGFSQIRMNGMEGPYSQILINTRPIFSGLAGVYGLELIPSNMIERVEVIRGGGSALYGSNAIAGTINLILKDPINSSYELGIGSSFTGLGFGENIRISNDFAINANASLVSSDTKTGMSIIGFYRDRNPYDANGDDFSEISALDNSTIGTRLYHRFSSRSKLSLDFFNIRENRRGGNDYDLPNHVADISEAVNHKITTGALTLDLYLRSSDKLSIFTSAQNISRDSYYGAEQSLSDYGHSDNLSTSTGVQYNLFFGNSNLILGFENNYEILKDEKLGYPDLDAITLNPGDNSIIIPYHENTIISNQVSNISGLFAQYDIKFSDFLLSIGGRWDNYKIIDKQYEDHSERQNVLSPRATIKYDLFENLQLRTSYSQGYRAPQIFDEDLHIEVSGARKTLHVNDPNLKQETSNSYMASIDYNHQIGNMFFGVLIEGFHTRLNHAFVNEYGTPDEDGTVIYTRKNAEEGASVQGFNIELNIVPSESLNLKGGFTLQQSKYAEVQEFEERRFFRTPDDYGYFTMSWDPVKAFGISATGNYTGKMLVPYFGLLTEDPEVGQLNTTDCFFDLGIKVKYQVKLNGAYVQLYTGMKNIFNAYQNDFDFGIERDPGYIYGPINPRTFYIGMKLGNQL